MVLLGGAGNGSGFASQVLGSTMSSLPQMLHTTLGRAHAVDVRIVFRRLEARNNDMPVVQIWRAVGVPARIGQTRAKNTLFREAHLLREAMVSANPCPFGALRVSKLRLDRRSNTPAILCNEGLTQRP
jgi:hypothetical protein